jgi:uncharacterized protein YbjT (DUF2867 family)
MRYLVAGATGLTGSAFCRLAAANQETSCIYGLSRRPQPGGGDRLHWLPPPFPPASLPEADVLVLAMGTTMAKAGSREAFLEADVYLPLQLASLAHAAGCRRVLLVSARGADDRSLFFYSRAKAAAEKGLAGMDWELLGIVRPSLLLGQRQERRPGEWLAQRLTRPLRMLLPASVRPVTAAQVAEALFSLRHRKGSYILENEEIAAFSG